MAKLIKLVKDHYLFTDGSPQRSTQPDIKLNSVLICFHPVAIYFIFYSLTHVLANIKQNFYGDDD